jgi:Protein of unknown function (DUF2971)
MILYHYCSSSTFDSIIKNRSIWLSALSLSNDALEGKLVRQTFQRLIQKDQIQDVIAQHIHLTFDIISDRFDALGFCLSQNGDLLSQWRGYADAYGFSIGFSKLYLDKLSDPVFNESGNLRLNKVKYSSVEHEAAIKPIYDKVQHEIKMGHFTKPVSPFFGMRTAADIKAETEEYNASIDKLVTTILLSVGSMFSLKSDAFEEESEWRLTSLVMYKYETNYSIRATRDKLIPYRACRLKELGIPPIVEVVIGPKNSTPIEVVESYLSSLGYSNVAVRRSRSTYR